MDSLGFVDLAFLKVDAQGADGEVLMGAWDTIRSCRPWIVFEWEDALSQAYNVALGDLIERLQEIDYVVRVLKRHNAKQVDYVALPAAEAAALAPLSDCRTELEPEKKGVSP